jgi:hypothetical protein
MTSSAPILNPVQQRFVSAVLQGKSQAEAYKAAGYPGADKLPAKTAQKKGNSIANGQRVREALARARENVQARVELTTADLVEQLMEARDLAFKCDPPQVSAAVAATLGIGKLLGLAIDRSEVNVIMNKPSLLPTHNLELSVDEWRRQFGSEPH